MAESGDSVAEKEAREREWLDLLRHYVKNVVPKDPVAAVVDFLIEQGNLAPLDLIAASRTEWDAWTTLQLLVRRVRTLVPKEFDGLAPLALWALDAADGTRCRPKKLGRPPLIHRVDRPVLDLIEASRTELRAWYELQFLVRRARAQAQREFAQLPPLFQWALDAADGTREPPTRRRGRPAKGHPMFRNYVIAGVIDEIVAIDLRHATGGTKERPSACQLVAPVVHLAPESLANLWDRRNRERRNARKKADLL